MQLLTLVAGLALASSAMAYEGTGIAVTKPEQGAKVNIGNSTSVEWDKDAARSNNQVIKIELLGGKDPGTLQPCGDVIPNPINNVGTMQWDLSDFDATGARWACEEAWDNLNQNVFGLRFTFADNEQAYSSDFRITRYVSAR